jgi:hypothetical protein
MRLAIMMNAQLHKYKLSTNLSCVNNTDPDVGNLIVEHVYHQYVLR